MKLRTAKKIYAAIGTPDSARYTATQLDKACDRMERTNTSREANAFWAATLDRLGPLGRADLVFSLQMSAMARKHGLKTEA